MRACAHVGRRALAVIHVDEQRGDEERALARRREVRRELAVAGLDDALVDGHVGRVGQRPGHGLP